MYKIFLLCLLFSSGTAVAQLPNQPDITQYCVSTGTTCVFGKNITSGSLVYVQMHDETNATAPTISDTLTTSYILDNNGTTNSCGFFYTWHGITTSSGSNTITLSASGSFRGFQAYEIYIPGTFSVDVASFNSWASIGNVPLPTITTTNNGELIIGGAHSCNSNSFTAAEDMQWLGSQVNGDSTAAEFLLTGTAGSISKHIIWNGGASSSGHAAIIAFKTVSNITITTTALPDASTVQSYSASLQSIGGTGTITWTLSSGSLPTGLSISGSKIIGTPTGGDKTFTIQASDGTNTTTKILSIHVGNALNTPTIVATTNESNCTTPIPLTVNPTVGNTLIGLSENGASGSIPTMVVTSGTGTAVFKRIPIIGNSSKANILAYLGTVTGSGTMTIGCPGFSSENTTWFEISGVQASYDVLAVNETKKLTGSPFTSSSITVPISGSISLAVAFDFDVSGVTLTGQTPFSNQTAWTGNFTSGETVAATGVSTGAQTVSFTQSNTALFNSVLLLNLPPSVSGNVLSSVSRKKGFVN